MVVDIQEQLNDCENSEKHKVSVIVPTYGLPKFLSGTIDSVVNQTYSNIELIIVDDNDPDSPARDKTEKLINDYHAKGIQITYIKHPKNLNGAVARNTGIQVAGGDFIAFLDSDDEYLPTRIEKLVSTIEKQDGGYIGVYTGCEFRVGGKEHSVYTEVKSGSFLVETLACEFMFCTGSNIFVKREVIEELGGFDERFTRHQDYEFLVRLFERYSLIGLQEVLVIKNNENFNLPNPFKMAQIKEQYIEKFKYLIAKLTPEEKAYVFQCNSLAIAEQAFRVGQRKLGFSHLKKARESSSMSLNRYLRLFAMLILGVVKK